jgi:hypothetical protein
MLRTRTFLPRLRSISIDFRLAALVGSASFILYWLTLSPGVEGGDAGEFQFVPYVLGVPHQTGYPLYVLLGKLWSFLPIGSIAYRMNLLSALFGAMTVAVIYLILRSLDARSVSALASAASLALAELFWISVTVAGVRALTTLFFSLTFWLAFEWRRRVLNGNERNRSWLLALAFLIGLSLTHHRTTILALPPLAMFLLWTDKSLLSDYRALFAGLLLMILPLSLYLFIFFRAPNAPFSAVPIRSLRDFAEFVLASGVLVTFRPWSVERVFSISNDYLQGVVRVLTWPGALLSLWGGFALLARQRKPLVTLLFFLTLVLVFTYTYGGYGWDPASGELVTYLLPSYLVLAICIGMGVDWLFELLEKTRHRRWFFYLSTALLIVSLLALFSWETRASYGEIIDRRTAPSDIYRQQLRGEGASRFVDAALAYVENGGVVLSDWEQAAPLLYKQLAEGERLDITVHSPIRDWREWLAKAEREERPFYLTRPLVKVLGTRNLTCAGPLIQIQESPAFEAPTHIDNVNVDLDGQLQLVGYTLLNQGRETRVGALSPGDVVQILLYWRALAFMDRNYSISVRLVGPEGEKVAQFDALHPVLSLYPTSLWQEGEVVADYYELQIPKGSSQSSLNLEVVVYERLPEGRLRNLTVVGSQPPTDSVRLTTLEIE